MPSYYRIIQDEWELTPKHIAQILDRNEKRIQMWFSQGLKHGKLLSIDPTRHRITGLELKRWLFVRDYPKIVKQYPILLSGKFEGKL